METWHNPTYSLVAGWGLLFYKALVTYSHAVSRGTKAAVYEALWACNIALILAAIGMITHSVPLISAGVVMVSLAHTLWTVDAIAWKITGTFPLGNAKYLEWRSTSTFEILTTLHHCWFIPVCLMALYGNGRLEWSGLWLAFQISAVLGLFCRVATPKMLGDHYLNINMAHARSLFNFHMFYVG